MHKIDVRVPYEPGGQLGRDYNRIMEETNYQWVLFLDHDIFLCNPHWYHICQKAIETHPKAGMFSCWTNNLGNTPQRHPQAPVSDCLDAHRHFARYLWNTHQYNNTSIDKCSGMLMLVNKVAWGRAGGFPAEGLFKEDWTFTKRLLKAGFLVFRIDGLYVYHMRDRKSGSWIEGHKTSKELRDERMGDKRAKKNK